MVSYLILNISKVSDPISSKEIPFSFKENDKYKLWLIQEQMLVHFAKYTRNSSRMRIVQNHITMLLCYSHRNKKVVTH